MMSSFPTSNHPKIILITGSNSVLNGIIPANIGVLLKANGYHVAVINMDSCINYNAASLDPSRYGELYVCDDGEVAPFNCGNYQRFLNQKFSKMHNLTLGKINKLVENNVQKGIYNGNKIKQRIYVDAIIEWIKDVCRQPINESNTLPNICIIELGGDFSECEMKPFAEALRHFKSDKTAFMQIHISKIVGGDCACVLKSIQNLHSARWNPDMIICRSKKAVAEKMKEEIAKHASLQINEVVNILDVENTNSVPLLLQQQNIYSLIAEKLQLEHRPNVNSIMLEWSNIVNMGYYPTNTVKIALVGKYFKHPLSKNENQIFRDSYASVINALNDAGLHEHCKVEIIFVWAEDLEIKDSSASTMYEEKRFAALKLLKEAHGIVITAGFNVPGFEGMMQACKYAREEKKPLLSICYGMQCAIIEYAQNVLEIKGAWSTKLWDEQNAKCKLPPLKPEQKVIIRMLEGDGENNERLRLGSRTTTFLTKNCKLYGKKLSIQERHRHGYEVNPQFVSSFIASGLRFIGMGVDENGDGEVENMPESSKNLLEIAQRYLSDDEETYIAKINNLCNYSITTKTAIRMEMMELEGHPYYIGVQFHPEFKSRPTAPSPPFVGLVQASVKHMISL